MNLQLYLSLLYSISHHHSEHRLKKALQGTTILYIQPRKEMATIIDQTFGKGSVPSRGVFIQMSGAPGSGKSTMAKLLRQSIGGLVIDHDVIRSSLLEDSDLPFDEVAKKAYRL